MKYLIKKLIKNTHQIECIVGWIRKIQHSSSPTILAPFADASNLSAVVVVVVVISVDLISFSVVQ